MVPFLGGRRTTPPPSPSPKRRGGKRRCESGQIVATPGCSSCSPSPLRGGGRGVGLPDARSQGPAGQGVEKRLDAPRPRPAAVPARPFAQRGQPARLAILALQ